MREQNGVSEPTPVVTRKTRRYYWWLALIMGKLLLLGIGLFVLVSRRENEPNKQLTAVPPSVSKPVGDPIAVEYSQEDIHQFFDQWMKPTIDQLFLGHTGNRLIDQRFGEIHQMVITRYQSKIYFDFNEGYIVKRTVERVAYAESGLANGHAQIRLFVPACMDFMAEIKGLTDNPPLVFRAHLLCTLMHEMEHCALGHLEITQPTFEQVIENEKITWHNTCLYTIQGLEQQCGDSKVIGPRFWPIYLKWVKSGRSLNSPEWQAEIRDLYKDEEARVGR